MSVFHNIYKPQFDESLKDIRENMSDSLFTTWFTYYLTVISTFTWGNLPKPTLLWQPEQYLTYNGKFAFFEHENSYKILPCMPSGNLLENGQYSMYTMIARNGETYIRNIEDVEICYCNSLRFPTLAIIQELADKSNNALLAVDTALARARQPKIIGCEDESVVTKISNAINNKDNANKLALVTDNEGIGDNQLSLTQLFDNRADDVLALWDVHVRYRNLFYSTFGVDNVEIQKRERLTEAEGSGNDEIVRYSLLTDMYKCRKDFIDRVKEHYNYEMALEINRDIATVYNIETPNAQKLKDQNTVISKGANLTANPDGGEVNE